MVKTSLSFQPHLSTERELVLDNVDFTTSGTFRCEVSGDAPMFQTASTEGVMAVVGKMRPISLEKTGKNLMSNQCKIHCVNQGVNKIYIGQLEMRKVKAHSLRLG